MEGELTNEVIRGITGFWVGRVDSIHLIRFDILCNGQGGNETERSTRKAWLAYKHLDARTTVISAPLLSNLHGR